jgi:Tripartite tricarboxylate transporter TctB family
MGTARLLTADRIGGLIWFVFGAAIVYGSWTMDRLESQNIQPVTAPGLVPGLLGACIMAFALVLLLRSGPPSTAAPAAPTVPADMTAAQPAPVPAQAFHWKRVAVSLVLCLTYGAVLLGSGVHYGILTAAFLFLHILLLDETEHVPARFTLRRLVTAAIIAPTVATIVTLVFQHLFLVRLP